MHATKGQSGLPARESRVHPDRGRQQGQTTGSLWLRTVALGCAVLLSACADEKAKGPDVTPPETVLDLRIEPGTVDSSVVLVWTAPGDDGDRGQATRYDIRISTQPPTVASWFDSVASPVDAPVPTSAGREERWPLDDLVPDSTYYARLRAEDDNGNLSELSNEASSAVPDLVPPAAIVDLRIEELTSSWTRLAWSATGDDGVRGRARRFDLRVANAPIDPDNWDEATPLDLPQTPGEPGTSHEARLDGLFATQTYYYAIRAVDEAGLLSPLAPPLRVDTPTIRVLHTSGERTAHPDLRTAIDAAIPRETIELGEGVFTGDRNRNLELRGKPLTIRGAGTGERATVIDPERGGRAFSFSFPEESGAFLQDLVLQNGLAGIGENFGGAALCFGGASPTFVRCLFQNNEAIGDGGAIAARRGSSPRITDCVFQDNRSGASGGAIAAAFNSRPGLWDTVFSANRSLYWGGAVQLEDDSSADIVGCRFTDNRVEEYGGAVASEGSHPMIRDCLFESNFAQKGGGAVVCADGSSPIILTSRFYANSAGSWAGAIYCWESSTPEVSECVFAENEAEQGGAFLCWIDSTVRLTSCTLVANRAGFGTAIRAVGDGSGAWLDRSIVAFGLRSNGSPNPGSIRCEQGAVLEATCTLIYGNDGGDWIHCLDGDDKLNGNIWQDPLLCDVENREYQLRTDSPCVDAGDCGRIGAYPAACPPPRPGSARLLRQ